MKFGLGLMLFVSVVGAQQTASTPSPAAPATPQAGAARVYTNAALHLTFSYPAELVPRDPATVAAEGRRMIYGEDTTPESTAGSSSGHEKSEACAKVLLAVGKGKDENGAAEASIALFDVNAQCYPAKVFKNKKTMDRLMTNLVRQGTTLMGMMPIEEPARYAIEGHEVRFGAAQGTPVTKSDLQTGAAELIAVVATEENGHLLCWMVEADDLAMFNRMLQSQVDFGMGKPEALFAGQFQ